VHALTVSAAAAPCPVTRSHQPTTGGPVTATVPTRPDLPRRLLPVPSRRASTPARPCPRSHRTHTENQDFTVTAAGANNVFLGGDVASRTRTYTATVPAGTSVDVQLFAAANVIVAANGTVTFVDADGNNVADPGTTTGATITSVNGVPGGSPNAVISNGTVTFTVLGAAARPARLAGGGGREAGPAGPMVPVVTRRTARTVTRASRPAQGRGAEASAWTGRWPPTACSTSGQECYLWLMDVGLRELRQQASELVRRAEAGESITVTVSGRPAARLVPADRNNWRRFSEVAELFAGPADADWQRDRALIDADLHDPWTVR